MTARKPKLDEMGDTIRIRVHHGIDEIGAEVWDACANPAGVARDPFVSFAFLSALEDSGAVGLAAGWVPQHLAIEDEATGGVVAVMPCYLKNHSQGEYIFDYGWAHAFERAGGDYYPKLQTAVPFTPVPGRRFLTSDPTQAAQHEAALLSGILQLLEHHRASSFHATFCLPDEFERMGKVGMLQRTGTQFHWLNKGYETFDEFLGTLASRKRKIFKRERRQALESDIKLEQFRGDEITEAHWDAMYRFYLDTGSRKWGSPYLNRESFSLIGERMADDVLLVFANRDGAYVAGAMHVIGGDAIYGRYWGCSEYHAFLHFEACYYQAIDYAIANKLARVEAGAQGEHKLVRGYEPVETYSVHYIADPGLRRAVARFLDSERHQVTRDNAYMAEMTPFKKSNC